MVLRPRARAQLQTISGAAIKEVLYKAEHSKAAGERKQRGAYECVYVFWSGLQRHRYQVVELATPKALDFVVTPKVKTGTQSDGAESRRQIGRN
ncbi:hypothetical protein [Ferrimicrobium sp.]|uniref:hypothetical protein n=1 Tax=Ferrimicrobium sp. TaxID=2926050 RepID=UPI00262E460F|nr:hypothetical protein [Ferrimicrobium sp.]